MHKRKTNHGLLIISIIVICILVVGVLKNVVPSLFNDTSNTDTNLILISKTNLNDTFQEVIFKNSNGTIEKYHIHILYDDKLVKDRVYNIKYHEERTNIFRPDHEIYSLVQVYH